MSLNSKTSTINGDLANNRIDQGKTGITRVGRGDMLFSSKPNAEFFSKLTIGQPGEVLSVSPAGLPIWGTSAILNLISPNVLDPYKIYVGASTGVAQQTTLIQGDGILIDNDIGAAELTVAVSQSYVLKRIFLNQ